MNESFMSWRYRINHTILKGRDMQLNIPGLFPTMGLIAEPMEQSCNDQWETIMPMGIAARRSS